MAVSRVPPVPPLTKEGFSAPVWQQWLGYLRDNVAALATSIQIATANGFAGLSTIGPGGAEVITLSVTVSGVLKGSGGQLAPAISGTDYLASLTITGDATGANVGNSLALTLANTGTATGTFNNVTVNLKGLVTAGTNIGYLTGNQTITLSGDATGSGATAITVTLAASGVTPATYGSSTTIPQIVVDGKGRVTAASSVAVAFPAPGFGSTASRPASPALGYNYFDTTLGQPVWVKSLGPVVWVNSAGVVV